MKLDAITISYIQTVVKTAKLVNIDNVIIEPGMVRAYDQENGVIILQDKDVPEMPFGSIGMTRLDIFVSRYDLLRTQDKFSIEVDIDEDAKCVRGIIMKAKGTKIDYRCMKPQNIKAPRQVNDTLKHRVKLNGDSVVLLNKAVAAMSSPEFVTLISNDGVSLELSDINNDKFNHTFMEKVETLTPDASGKFAHRYFVKTLLPLLKQDSNGHFDVGAKGILAFYVNNLTVHVLPQA
jgi:hypothetical protein